MHNITDTTILRSETEKRGAAAICAAAARAAGQPINAHHQDVPACTCYVFPGCIDQVSKLPVPSDPRSGNSVGGESVIDDLQPSDFNPSGHDVFLFLDGSRISLPGAFSINYGSGHAHMVGWGSDVVSVAWW